jgi:hypothetical protein
MTDTTDETKIARDRRRANELSGGECLAAARLGAEQLIQYLGRVGRVTVESGNCAYSRWVWRQTR